MCCTALFNLGPKNMVKNLSETSNTCEQHYLHHKTKEARVRQYTPCLTDDIWSNGGKIVGICFLFFPLSLLPWIVPLIFFSPAAPMDPHISNSITKYVLYSTIFVYCSKV